VTLRPRTVTLLATLLACGLTDLIILTPSLHFAYRSVPLHAMLETAAALIGLLTTFLLWGRLSQRRRLDDLLLFLALGVLSFTNLFFATIPAALFGDTHTFSTWTTLAGSALGAALLALAALVPRRQLSNYRRATGFAVLAAFTVLVSLGDVVGMTLERLPAGIDPAISPVARDGAMQGNAVIVATQMLIALFFAIAAIGFTRRAERDHDELLLWLGAGSVVAAAARLNYFAFPSLYSEWVYTGDAFRLVWHVLLFVGAAREIRIYQRAYAESRVLEERRRIARDLHDGLAQELAFIASKTRDQLAHGASRAQLAQVASSAQRGLDESRRAIATLSGRTDEPFEQALTQAVEEVAERIGVRVEIDAEPAPEIRRDEQEQLLRIVREAVTNAGRHAQASLIRVQFTNGGPLRLLVEDDGLGFDPDDIGVPGFGLVGMRERAAAIGGRFEVDSSPHSGTRIEVNVP
jgi:signal transduction histidine kinase